MDALNISLWTISITLALAGITFGIIASINSNKAAKQVKDLVADQLVSEEASKYFFTIPQSIGTDNKSVLTRLKSKDEIDYIQYSILAAKTRFAPIPGRVERHLKESEFSDIMNRYIKEKMELDALFIKIIKNYSVLTENKSIPKGIREKLIKYHIKIGELQSIIMKDYYLTSKR